MSERRAPRIAWCRSTRRRTRCPFADGFFDAVVSVDAYHYFGTDQLYLPTLASLLRPGGRIGIAVPGVVDEFDAVSEHLEGWWDPELWSFHSPTWWRRVWERSGVVDVELFDLIPGAVDEWALREEVSAERGEPRREGDIPPVIPGTIEVLRTDGGRALGFVRVVAHAVHLKTRGTSPTGSTVRDR